MEWIGFYLGLFIQSNLIVLENFLPLIELILPDFIIDNYLLTNVEKSDGLYHVHLEEKNYSEDDPRKADLPSKGFFPTITLQDFPIRGYKEFLHIKRRRWLNTKTGKVEYRDWNEVSEGTQMTSEFSAFLLDRRPKGIGGYQG